MTAELSISDELLAARNEKGAKLARAVTGPAAEVFTRVLKGLSGAKLTRAGAFQARTHGGCAVRCTFKADDGFLYPLERAFFYVHKPPMLFMHDDIASVEFQRQGGGAAGGAVRTFDLVLRLKGGAGAGGGGGQEFQFRGINKLEWEPLFAFIQERGIRVANLAEAREGPGGAAARPLALSAGGDDDDDDDDDAGLRAARAEAGGGGGGEDDDDDSDEDFDAGAAAKRGGGSGSSDDGSGSDDDSGSSGSDDGSDDDDDSDDSSDAEVVSEGESRVTVEPLCGVLWCGVRG